MAYIGENDVKAIREALKVRFPNLKFGARKGSGSLSVDVTIKSGNVDLSNIFTHGDGYCQVNQYHTYQYGEHQALFDEIVKIIKTAPAQAGGRAWFDESDAMTDYFHTAYYIHLNVGEWNKPYQFKA